MGPNSIGNLSKLNNINLNKKVFNTKSKGETGFGDYLKNAINKVNDLQIESENSKKLLATGQIDNIHQVSIAAEKADIALQFTMSVRNKVLDAYNEIMRMQV